MHLQVFSQLGALLQSTSLSVHLVEVSPRLSQVQAQNLTGEDSQSASDENEPVYRRGTTATGLPVSWYRRIEDVPVGELDCAYYSRKTGMLGDSR